MYVHVAVFLSDGWAGRGGKQKLKDPLLHRPVDRGFPKSLKNTVKCCHITSTLCISDA